MGAETPPLTPLTLCAAGAYQAPRGRDFPRHAHDTWELVYYRDGNILCPLGDAVYEGLPGVLLLTPPHTPHAEVARTAYSNYFLVVDAPADAPWPLRCYDDADGSLERVCAALVREWSTPADEAPADRDALVALLLAELDLRLRRARAQADLLPAEALVRRAERLIAERATARPAPKIGDIAREVGVAPSTLRALFAERRGGTPRAHLRRSRLRHALALLRGSTLTLDAVAGLCGYDSASHLSRDVKRETGESPGALRQSGPRGTLPR
jgi:AraC-like DNA-binding protein